MKTIPKSIALIVETDDFRGDHAKDVEHIVHIDATEPIWRILEVAEDNKLYCGTAATIRIVPESEYEPKESDE